MQESRQEKASDTYGSLSITASPRDAGARKETAGSAKVAMRLAGLWKTYPGNAQPAVKDLSLDVYDGEIVTMLGPSGCG